MKTLRSSHVSTREELSTRSRRVGVRFSVRKHRQAGSRSTRSGIEVTGVLRVNGRVRIEPESSTSEYYPEYYRRRFVLSHRSMCTRVTRTEHAVAIAREHARGGVFCACGINLREIRDNSAESYCALAAACPACCAWTLLSCRWSRSFALNGAWRLRRGILLGFAVGS